MQTVIDERTPAGFWPRAAALLIDRSILFLGLLLIRLPVWIAALGTESIFSANILFQYSLLEVVCWVLRSLYFVLMTYFGGATLGKKALGLRVITEEGAQPGFWTVLSRETFARYLSSILQAGYLLVLVDGKKRSLHDIICDTRVIYAMPMVRTAASASVAGHPVRPTDDPERDWYKPYRI